MLADIVTTWIIVLCSVGGVLILLLIVGAICAIGDESPDDKKKRIRQATLAKVASMKAQGKSVAVCSRCKGLGEREILGGHCRECAGLGYVDTADW